MPSEWPPEEKARIEASQAQRAQVREQHPKLFEDLSACFFRHDPIGINFESNTDEYDPEAGTIIPRLSACANEKDVLSVVHEEFVSWFGDDVAGPKSKYVEMSAEVWRIWKGRESEQGR